MQDFIFGAIVGFVLAMALGIYIILSFYEKDDKLHGKQTSWQEDEDDEYHN